MYGNYGYFQNNYYPGQSVCPPGSVPYIIQPGDTFWLIAQRLGVPVEQVLSLNPGVNPYNLMIGQRVCVPGHPVPPPMPPPVLPIFRYPCSIPLLPVHPEKRAGGSVWIREDEFSVTGYSTLFAATYLPEPKTLGKFDCYIGRITIAQPAPDAPIVHSALLTRIERPLHQITWAGTRIFPEGPALTDIAEILPYNAKTDVVGPAILRNTFKSCGHHHIHKPLG